MNAEINLDFIHDNPWQPRVVDDPVHIKSLARSIAADGLLQVPKARPNPDPSLKGREKGTGGYQLAFGHSRRKAFEWLCENWEAQGLTHRYNGYTVMPVDEIALTDEEMYRYAVTENVQRKDLNPIELAKALERYMREFDANSKKAGELFGMNDATVRGLVRMLELPAAAQEKVASGAITQGTARELLSMQKIAPEKVVMETIKEIEKGSDQWGDKVEPAQIIESVLDQLDEVEEMWNDNNRDGKPRSQNGYRGNGWLLDMKNFPNKLLPALTPVEAAIALGIQDDEEKLEFISTWMGNHSDNMASEEALAELIAWGLEPELVERIQHLLNPPACSACPFYTKVRGTHYCGMKTCHTRKTVAWNSNAVQQTSKSVGITIYSESDGSYRVLSYRHDKLFNKKIKGLRLIPSSLVNSHQYQSFQGVNSSVCLVVATGDAIDKLGSEGPGGGSGKGKKTEKEKAEMRMMKIYRVRRKELLWEYTGAAQSLFEGVPIEVLRKICNWHFIGIDDRIPEEHDHPQTGTDAEKLEFQRRALVWRLIVGETSHYTRSDLVTLLNRFHKITQVKAPKALTKLVQEWQEEIHSVSTATTSPKGKGAKAKKA